MDLYLLRHGDVGKRISLVNDAALTESGKKEVAIIARSFKELNQDVSTILTSPLKPAVQTARILAEALSMKVKVLACDELAPEGSVIQLSDRLRHYPLDSSILIVGHEPYLTNMIYEIIFHVNRTNSRRKTREMRMGSPESIILKKAGIAKLRIKSMTPNLEGEMHWLMTPRIMKLIQGGQK